MGGGVRMTTLVQFASQVISIPDDRAHTMGNSR